MQQRRDEILAKKAKLAELKRQRELRTREISTGRQSISGSSSDVTTPLSFMELALTINSSLPQSPIEPKTAKS